MPTDKDKELARLKALTLLHRFRVGDLMSLHSTDDFRTSAEVIWDRKVKTDRTLAATQHLQKALFEASGCLGLCSEEPKKVLKLTAKYDTAKTLLESCIETAGRQDDIDGWLIALSESTLSALTEHNSADELKQAYPSLVDVLVLPDEVIDPLCELPGKKLSLFPVRKGDYETYLAAKVKT